MEIIQNGGKDIKVWTDIKGIEPAAIDQLYRMSRLPFVYDHIAVMPDVHVGKGATVGSVIATKGAIIPAAVGVDIGCFTGDTLIPLVDGKSYKIKDLADKAEEIIVFACNKDKKIIAAKATAKLTRKNAKLIKVTLDNEEEINCTPDHQFMLRDGSYLEAELLAEGQSLMPFYSKTDKEGYTLVKQPYSAEWQSVELIVSSSRTEEIKYRLSENSKQLFNHKVKSVELIEQIEDVYCLSVPDYNNFALSAGVFVHNCGMLAAKTNLNASNLPDSLVKLREEIEKIVPVGRLSHKDTKYGKDLDFNKLASYKDLPSKVIDRAMTQIGTLGGGNHFIEICLDQNNDVWIMLHSGSRNIGNEVASLYISKAKGEMKKFFINLEDPDLAYLSEQTDQFKNYVNDLFWCQEYAMKNRQIMFENVFKAIKGIFPAVELIGEVTSCHHNYVSIENHFGENVYVTRKGAIKADKGDIGIIPGSMGTKSYIVKGRGNADSFNSCSHGAGRKMSRTKAKSLYTYRDLIEQTKGVECRKDSGVVDEIPAAYKDIDAVMNNQSDLVDITAVLKQIVCVKG